MTLRIRKNQRDLTQAEKAAYVATVKKMKSNGDYDWYVLIHAESMHDMNNMWAHTGPAFLPWHRQFILSFELDLQKADLQLNGGTTSNLTLPYWDWMHDTSTNPLNQRGSIWRPDFMGGDGDLQVDPQGNPEIYEVTTGPFEGGSWTLVYPPWMAPIRQNTPYLSRSFGRQKLGPIGPAIDTLPSGDSLADALDLSIYDSAPWNRDVGRKPPPPPARFSGIPSFRNVFEGWVEYWNPPAIPYAENEPELHNRVHMWVGGSVSSLYTSPNDPVFFLHHCNVDRLWAQWQAAHPDTDYPAQGAMPGHNLHDPMPPWDGLHNILRIITPADVLYHQDLGYRYDTDPPVGRAGSTP